MRGISDREPIRRGCSKGGDGGVAVPWPSVWQAVVSSSLNLPAIEKARFFEDGEHLSSSRPSPRPL